MSYFQILQQIGIHKAISPSWGSLFRKIKVKNKTFSQGFITVQL
jgi:hypothetical protein